MIAPRERQAEAAIAAHYDTLDRYYRETWGEHLHHGLFFSGDESPEEATRALLDLVIARSGVRAGMSVCDVGCGYGATARVLASEVGTDVTALTISAAQLDEARDRERGSESGPTYLLRSWLENDLPAESFDAVLSVESLSHMTDKVRAFDECARVLRPGGRLVVCDWLSGEDPSGWEEHLLLEPICREGHLPSMYSISEYRTMIEDAGLRVVSDEDLSRCVRRTWTICIARIARRLLRDRDARRVLRSADVDVRFALTMLRIPVAYATGAMRLGVITAVKPQA